MTDSVAVVDVGSQVITCMLGHIGCGGKIVVDAESRCDYSGYMEGKILEPDRFLAAIDSVLSETESFSQKKIGRVYVGVPGQFSITKCKEVSVSFPRRRTINRDDVKKLTDSGNDFSYPGYELLHTKAVHYRLDNDTNSVYMVTGIAAKKLGAIITYSFADSDYMNLIKSSLKTRNIETAFISQILAESMYLVPEEIRDGYAVLIDSGYLNTDVAVIQEDGLLNHFSFTYGDAYIEQELNKAFGMTYEAASDIRKNVVYNINFDDGEEYAVMVNGDPYRYKVKSVNKYAKAVVNKIIHTVIDNINKNLCPENMHYILTGSGIACNRGIRDYFAKNLSPNTELGVPDVPRYEYPALAGVFSLLDWALRG